MRLTRAFLSLVAILFTILVFATPSNAQCGLNPGFEEFGLAAGAPFQAEIVFSSLASTDVRNVLAGPSHLVARDSHGRLRIDSMLNKNWKPSELDFLIKPKPPDMVHITMICDPVASTMTRINTDNATAEIVHSTPLAAESAWPAPGDTRPFCSVRLIREHRFMKLEDLGVRAINGVEAHGELFKVPSTVSSNIDDTSDYITTQEIWCSDQLSLVMLNVTRDTSTGAVWTRAIQNVERIEPDPSLFKIPRGYAVSEVTLPPSFNFN